MRGTGAGNLFLTGGVRFLVLSMTNKTCCKEGAVKDVVVVVVVAVVIVLVVMVVVVEL